MFWHYSGRRWSLDNHGLTVYAPNHKPNSGGWVPADTLVTLEKLEESTCRGALVFYIQQLKEKFGLE